MSICLYCNRDKPDEEFSTEHVIPSALSGNLKPVNPFLTKKVCGRCNNLAGLFIDGPFIKSWFIANYITDNVTRFVDLTPTTLLPFAYMGELNGVASEDRICDTWLGPTGDRVYHFHRPYPTDEDVPPFVGLPTTKFKKEIDSGFAFMFVRSNNPEWHPTIIYSFIENFPGADLYLGNASDQVLPVFKPIPDRLQELFQKLKALNGKLHHNAFRMGTEFGDRFMAKVALGLGSLVLNKSFPSGESANLLRMFMWERKSEIRATMCLKGNRFLGDENAKNALKQFLKWDGGHVLALMPSRDGANLYMNFFGVADAVMNVTESAEDFRGIDRDGIVYVIVPGLGRVAGPMNLSEFIAHTVEPKYINSSLQELENEMNKHRNTPPFMI